MTAIITETYQPCIVCGEQTNLIDYCIEQRLCSHECEAKYYKEINKKIKYIEENFKE